MKTFSFGQTGRQVVLLLHGGGLSWWNYREAAALLAKQFHVVMPVLNGHGGNDVPFTTMQQQAEEIIDLIDEQFQGHVLLLGGVSLGAQVVLEILSQRSEICSCAVVESALALPMPCTAAMIRPAFSLCYPLIQKRWFARLQFRSLHIQEALFEDYFFDTCRIASQDMIAFLTANASYRLKDSLADCPAKALVLAGSRERPIMKRSARLIASRLPNARLELLDGLRHGELSLNHAETYVGMLLALLSDSEAPA